MMNHLTIPITQTDDSKDLSLPSYATQGSAGMDLLAAIKSDVTLKAGERALVKTGISIALPEGYEAQVRPRSGLALKQGITTLNTPGTIDSDYRGEIGVILINHGSDDAVITRGMRIAQLIIAPVTLATWHAVTSLDNTERGQGGFGSTGTDSASSIDDELSAAIL